MLSYQIATLTQEELKELIASADDQYDNQIRVKKNGEVFISRTVGAQDIEQLQFRFETYDAGNGYVGNNRYLCTTQFRHYSEFINGTKNQ